MRAPSPSPASVLRAVVAGAACVLLAGCVQMPTSGPVVEPQVSTATEDVPGISFDPRPPQDGQTPTEIVAGFLEAMKATPVRTTVARQFLSREAADAWAPEQQVVTYGDLGAVVGQTSVRVPLTDVDLYDARGAWQGTRAGGELDLGLVQEDGQWRIGEVPDALIVPDSWFDDWYERVSLYYFDPASEVLVPEPVFVPRGDQLASSLVRGLLEPLPDEARDVVRTYFPPGTTHGLSVPVRSGIAEVSLTGDPGTVDDDTVKRMLAQLVWTLRQDQGIRAVELSIGGRAFSLNPGGATQVSLDYGIAYDPNGERADTDLFALQRGRVVAGALGGLEDTLGPLGGSGYDVRSIGASISGTRIAAVTGDGTGLYLAPTEAPGGEVVEPVVGASDLAPPHWDHRDRVWLLDRNGGRARVVIVVDGSAREVEVPGLTGERVTRMLVSRDSSRLVAVVRADGSDRVVAARVRHDSDGVVTGFTPMRTLTLPDDQITRVRDIGWRSPTTVSVLDISEEYTQVRTISVDGAPGEIPTTGTTRLRAPTRQLVTTPLDGSEVFALAGRQVFSLTRPERTVPDLPRGATSLTYVG